jgi:hypothetical protein
VFALPVRWAWDTVFCSSGHCCQRCKGGAAWQLQPGHSSKNEVCTATCRPSALLVFLPNFGHVAPVSYLVTAVIGWCS